MGELKLNKDAGCVLQIENINNKSILMHSHSKETNAMHISIVMHHIVKNTNYLTINNIHRNTIEKNEPNKI